MKRIILVTVGFGVLYHSAYLEASPSYYCYKTSEPIIVDGIIDEEGWSNVPWLNFYGLVDGSEAPYPSQVKMVWDSKYIYIAFNSETPNAWGSVSKEQGEPQKLRESPFIMHFDDFVKIFLDPDSDGKNYIEIHINALNHRNDMWVGYGSTKADRYSLDSSPTNWHLEWNCPGILSNVGVQGTLNNPHDTDKGWTLEVAIPWESMKQFTLGHCPPEAGDVWRAHLGRLYREKKAGDKSYYTWPVIGIEDCHKLDRYGYLIFSDKPAVMKSKTADSSNPLKWKMAWSWTMRDRPDEEIVRAAQELGFNVLNARSTNMVQECQKAGLKAIATLSFGGAPPEYGQVILPRPELENWINPAAHLYQDGGEPIQGGEPSHKLKPWCPDHPKTLEYGQNKIDTLIAQGYDGVALDAIGYQNYYACYCPLSKAHHAKYQKEHSTQTPQEAIYKSSEESLINLCTALIDYAHSKKNDIIMTCHIWPHFAPNPLYGNKIPFDYCGQTAAWFYKPYWQEDKIRRYAYDIVTYADDYHGNSIGAPFIGIFTLPPLDKHHKSSKQVREELRIIKQSGASAIQIAELGHILNDPNIAEVVKEELISNDN